MRRRSSYNRNRNREKKERMIMLGSAVFVLTALTMTGVYVKGNNEKNKNDGYTIDFTALQDSADDKSDEILQQTTPAENRQAAADNSGAGTQMAKANVGGTTQPTGQTTDRTGTKMPNAMMQDDFMDYLPETDDSDVAAEAPVEEEPIYAQAAEFSELEDEESVATEGEAVASFNQPELGFSENDTLTWPIVGNVLVNYSMDKTTYFATLQQYKYSPAIVIAAMEGETIAAAADGRVLEIYEDEEIGKAVVMDLGGGYQLTYGQLEDIQVSKGSYVKTGDIVGSVAAPTKYYSVEGANVYFKLTKDGTPVNPMGKLN